MTGFLVGRTTDGQDYRLPDDFLDRSISIIAPPNEGKTDLQAELFRYISGGPDAAVAFDYAGTFTENVERSVAVEAQDFRACTESRSAGEAAADAHIARHAFVHLGESRPTLGIDILRPVLLPNGMRESYGMVAGRVVEGFRFEDREVRVRFTKYGRALCVILSAAGRPITEYYDLLHGVTPVCNALRATHAERGVQADPHVVHAWRLLDELHDLAPTLKRTYLDSTESAFEPFSDEDISSFFTAGNIDLGDLAFRGNRLLLCPAGIPSFDRQNFVCSMLFRSLMHLSRRRKKGTMTRLIVFIDEVGWLDYDELGKNLELLRNFGVSLTLSRQHRTAHFKDERTADLIDGTAGTLIDFATMDANAMRRLVPMLKAVTPDSLFIEKEQASSADTNGWANGTVHAENWQSNASKRASLHPGSPERITTHLGPDGRPTGTSVVPASPAQFLTQDLSGGGTGGSDAVSSQASGSHTDSITVLQNRIPVAEQKEAILDAMIRSAPYTLFVTRARRAIQLIGIQARQYNRIVTVGSVTRDLVAELLDRMTALVPPPATFPPLQPPPTMPPGPPPAAAPPQPNAPRPPVPPSGGSGAPPPAPQPVQPPPLEPPDPRDEKPPEPKLKPNGKLQGRHSRAKKKP